MHGLQRRPSGIYVARLAIPVHLRARFKRTEFIQSTGSRDRSLAKAIACELVAAWRVQLLAAEGKFARMQVSRITSTTSLLVGSEFIDLMSAGDASGIGSDRLLRAASEGDLDLFVNVVRLVGCLLPVADLEPNLDPLTVDLCEYVVPAPDDMSDDVWDMSFTGTLQLLEPTGPALALLDQQDYLVPLLLDPGSPGYAFAPAKPLVLNRQSVQLRSAQVEALRRKMAALLSSATAESISVVDRAGELPKPDTRRLSQVIDDFMEERSQACNAEQARRIRQACDMFIELMGDPFLRELDKKLFLRYQNQVLPTVPHRENQLRAKYGTTNIQQSIELARQEGLPTMTPGERRKRLAWLSEFVGWLATEGLIAANPSKKLIVKQKRKEGREQDRRHAFTAEHLMTIFSAQWFATGKGELTKAGTYREFLPLYYWLPLLGLYTGARINELCQLSLEDIRQTSSGVWFIKIIDEGDEGKRLKNSNSRRLIPMHKELVELGLPGWMERLKQLGHDRLFPELKLDATKGYSKEAVKWFSRFLAAKGFVRDGTLVFHSFRHTFITHCMNDLSLPELTVAQISGHARGKSVLTSTYRKDAPPDDLIEAISRLNFPLPKIARFDVDAGQQALQDAFRRKNKGRGLGREPN